MGRVELALTVLTNAIEYIAPTTFFRKRCFNVDAACTTPFLLNNIINIMGVVFASGTLMLRLIINLYGLMKILFKGEVLHYRHSFSLFLI